MRPRLAAGPGSAAEPSLILAFATLWAQDQIVISNWITVLYQPAYVSGKLGHDAVWNLLGVSCSRRNAGTVVPASLAQEPSVDHGYGMIRVICVEAIIE